MLKLIKGHKSEFFLMLGTLVSQMIAVLLTPVLTRLYHPEAFGLFALFSSYCGIFSSFVNFRYEMSILLVRTRIMSFYIMKICFVISILTTVSLFLSYCFISYFDLGLKVLDKIEDIAFPIIIGILLTNSISLLYLWNNKLNNYKILSVNKMLFSIVVFGAQWSLFYLKVTKFGLIYGFLLGQVILLIYFFSIHLTTHFTFLNKLDLRLTKVILKKFKKFPMYDIPSSLFSILSSQIPVIFFSSKFDNTVAGQYFLTQAILQAPITLVSNSFLDTFKNKAYSEKLQTGNIRNVFIQYLKLLFFIAIIPSIIFFFFIEDIIVWVYGDNWELAGLFAKILIPAMFLRFIANPLSYTFYIFDQQKLNMISMFTLFLYMVFSFYYFNSVTSIVFSISIGYSILYLCYILYSVKLVNLFQKKSYVE